jgi:uncharacterized membrane protein HdeD (DUF308 family)
MEQKIIQEKNSCCESNKMAFFMTSCAGGMLFIFSSAIATPATYPLVLGVFIILHGINYYYYLLRQEKN